VAIPTFVAAGSKAQAAGTLSIPYYAGHTTNDIALIFVAGYADVTFGAATGFTAETQVNHALGLRTRLYWRRLDGSESANISITGATSNANIGVMLGFSGCAPSGTPYEDYGSVTGDVASNLVTSGATTTAGSDRLLVRSYVHEMGVASSPPASWTERFDSFETVINAVTLAIDTLGVASSGTTAATSRNLGSGNGTSFAVLDLALKPQTGTAYTMAADKADLAAGGQDTTLKAVRTMSAANASLSIAGQNVTLLASHNPLAADFAALSLTAQDVGLNKGQRMAADVASLSIAGQNVTLTAIRTMPADNASLTAPGQDANLLHGHLVSAQLGTLTVNGQDVSFLFNRLIGASNGSLTFGGQVVLLTKTWLPLVADNATLTLYGQDVTLAKGRRIVADFGALTIAGQTVSFIGPRRFDIGEGVVITGTAYGYALMGRAAGYAISGRA
jgi:hypothetical protein